MKRKLFIITIMVCALLLGVGGFGWAKKIKPPPDPTDPPATPIDGYYFWRLGHMDGPHDSSKALGISRDGKPLEGTEDAVLQGDDCSLAGHKWADPRDVLLGDATTVYLSLFGSCGFVDGGRLGQAGTLVCFGLAFDVVDLDRSVELRFLGVVGLGFVPSGISRPQGFHYFGRE